jgi:hypothetical protein
MLEEQMTGDLVNQRRGVGVPEALDERSGRGEGDLSLQRADALEEVFAQSV